jgi:hypothetical protein
MPVALPRTLPYREGAAPPDGFRLETRVNRPLLIVGGALLGSAYAVSALTAGTVLSEEGRSSDEAVPLLFPIVGPFIALGTIQDADFSDSDGRLGATILLMDGITQVTGAVVFLAGLFSERKIWVRADIPQARMEGPAPVAQPEILVGPRSGAVRVRF